jgi:hypothetical protein
LARDHAHHAPSAAAPPATAQGAPAQRWLTDAPLREGMGRIGRTVATFQHYEHGHMNPGQAMALATLVERDILFLVANCKLDPAADAALHAIIARLSLAVQAVKADPGDRGAIPPMHEALRDYGRQFDDPGFNKGVELD